MSFWLFRLFAFFSGEGRDTPDCNSAQGMVYLIAEKEVEQPLGGWWYRLSRQKSTTFESELSNKEIWFSMI